MVSSGASPTTVDTQGKGMASQSWYFFHVLLVFLFFSSCVNLLTRCAYFFARNFFLVCLFFCTSSSFLCVIFCTSSFFHNKNDITKAVSQERNISQEREWIKRISHLRFFLCGFLGFPECLRTVSTSSFLNIRAPRPLQDDRRARSLPFLKHRLACLVPSVGTTSAPKRAAQGCGDTG